LPNKLNSRSHAPGRMQAIVLVCKEHDLLAVGGEF